MGSITVDGVSWRHPGGAELFRDVSFTIGAGEKAALVGANGVGKTTLMRLLAGDLRPQQGGAVARGRVGVMRQLVGMASGASDVPQTVRQLLISVAPAPVRHAAVRLDEVSDVGVGASPEQQMAYAHALAGWADAGGYESEVHWDSCCQRALGRPFDDVAERPLRTFSGGEQKRLALEALLSGDDEVLLLDEPDNFLDVPAKRWLEEQLRETSKTVLYISHDRELLAATATKIVTIEATGAWVFGGGFGGYAEARQRRIEELQHDRALFEAERKRLEELVAEMRRRARISETFAPKLKAAESRLRLFLEKNEAPELVREQRVDVRLRGARTGKKAVTVEAPELHGVTDPFDLQLWYGERVAVVGGNGAGKSTFLRVLGGDDDVPHDGSVRLGAGVVTGLFHQTHEHPDWVGRTPLDILHRRDVVRGPAMGMLRRYELTECAEQPFETLSGGQQARLQILLLELSGATLLLLDEPTDNLDLVSAEALETGLAQFQGTIVAVTHDRWFLRGFDRFVLFGDDCAVSDHLERPAALR